MRYFTAGAIVLVLAVVVTVALGYPPAAPDALSGGVAHAPEPAPVQGPAVLDCYDVEPDEHAASRTLYCATRPCCVLVYESEDGVRVTGLRALPCRAVEGCP